MLIDSESVTTARKNGQNEERHEISVSEVVFHLSSDALSAIKMSLHVWVLGERS